jgi:hypothetical protein
VLLGPQSGQREQHDAGDRGCADTECDADRYRCDQERAHRAVESAHVVGQELLAVTLSFRCSCAFDWKDEPERTVRYTAYRRGKSLLRDYDSGWLRPCPAICGELRMQIRTAPDADRSARGETRGNRNEPRSVIPMTRNMGTFDCGLRAFVVAPAAIVVAFLIGAGTIFGVILFVVAGVMLTTAVTAFCPTYTVLGISTRPGLHRVGHGLPAGHA